MPSVLEKRFVGNVSDKPFLFLISKLFSQFLSYFETKVLGRIDINMLKSGMIKKSVFFALSVFSLLIFSNQIAIAQDKKLSSSPLEFKSFFTKFKRAVERGDKTGVAAMTEFPFEYGFDAGDEGTMTRNQFIKRFSEVFGKNPKDFITEKNPRFSREGSKYYISTQDAGHLLFIKKGKTFKFASFIVEP